MDIPQLLRRLQQEVWPDAPPGVHIRNRYFDTTPLTLFSGIISEHGVYAPMALRTHLQHQEISPALVRLASCRVPGDDHGALPAHRVFLERLEQG